MLEKKYGFKHTKLLLNATYEQILNAINDYAKTLGPNANLLIYYAGHGQLDLGKRGYWIPVDAEIERNTRWILNVQIRICCSRCVRAECWSFRTPAIQAP